MTKRTLLLMYLLATLGGCAALGKTNQMSLLDPTLSAYTGAIRWGSIETAAGFARPRNGRKNEVNQNAFVGLKVTGYKVRINRIDENAVEANVSISFTFYHDDQGSIREVEQNSTWYYSSTDKTWYLDGFVPDFSRRK